MASYEDLLAEFGGNNEDVSLESQALLFSTDWDSVITETAQNYPNVPEQLVRSLIQRESSGDPYADIDTGTKWGKARGLGQFIDDTAKRYIPDWKDPSDSYDPVKNIKGIYAYLDDLVKETGSLEKALIRYHGGTADRLGTKSEDYAKQILSKVKGNTSFKPKSSSYEDLLAEFGGETSQQTEQVIEQPTEQVVSRGELAQSGDSFLNKLGQSATSSLAGVESAIAASPGLATDAILTLSNNINKAINFFTNKTFNKKFLAENMKAPEWAYDVAGKAKEKIGSDNKVANYLLGSFSSKNLKDIQQATSQSSKMTEEGKGVVGSLWSKLKKGEIKDAAEYLTYATVENGVQNILASVVSAYTARPELGLAILAGTSATDKMREYVENGNQTDDRTMQVLNSINTGLMEYAGERMGTYEILKPLRNKFFKIASEEGVDQAKKKITKPVIETIKNIAKNTGKEVSSEVFTQLGQNLGDIIAGDKEMTLKEAFSGAADAGLLAITSSGPMTTLGSISETKQDIRQQKLRAVDEQGNPVSTMTDPAQQLIDEQGEVDESPYIESFKMTEEDLLSRYEYDKEGRNLLKSAVTTDPKIDEETRTRLLSEMDSIDNITEEIDNEEESQETETLLNEQEPTVEPQSSQEATTPIPTTETSPNADLPSVETATTDVPVSTITTTEGAVQTPQNPATKEEEQVSNPVTSPSYITKRDDGTVVVDKRNITENEPLFSVLNSYRRDEFTTKDIKNLLSTEYSKLFAYKTGAESALPKIEALEKLYKELDDNVEYVTKDEFLGGLKSFGYSKKQTDIVTELVNNLKFDKFPKITNEKLLGKNKDNNFYVFSQNILSSDTPEALMHEVGHFSFYNVLSSDERMEYMRYAINRFYGTENSMDKDLAYKNVETGDNTRFYSNVSDNFEEYFAEQFRQYVVSNKVSDPQFKTLFEKLKEYLDAVLKAFRKTGYNKDLVKYFDKIIGGEKTNIELSKDQKKFISRLDVPEDKLSVAKEIVGNIDFSVPYQNASEEAKLGPKFKRLIRIIANDPEFSIELNGEEVTLKDAIKGKTRKQMAEIADLAGLGTELEAQGAGSTMKKQERRQFVESITNGMEYTPELEQQIKKEFAGNKDFSFDKIFEVQTGEISRKEQNRVYKEAIAKGYSGDKLTKYMTDELNKLPGKKVLLVRNPEKFAQLKGENAQNVDAKDIDIIYDKDVIDDKIKAVVTEIKKKRKQPKRYTQQEKEALYVNDKIKLKLGGGNIKTRFYVFVDKYLHGKGADSYRRQIYDLLEDIKDNDDPLVNKAIELIDEAIEFRKVSDEFTRLKAFTRRKSVKSGLKEENSDMIDINKRIAAINKKYQQFVDYQTLKRLQDRGGEVTKPKVVADTVRRLRGSDKYVVVNKETNKITTSERFDTKEAARKWINKNSEKVSSKIGEKYESVINQGFVKPISKTDKKKAKKLGLPEDTEFDFYQIIKTDTVKERISELKRKLTDSNGKMFDAERIRIEVAKIKDDYKALVGKKEVIKVTKNATLEEAVDNIGIQLKAKKRTDKQTKSALMWGYKVKFENGEKESSKSNWLKPFGLVGVNFRYKMQEMDDYDNKVGEFQKYILKPMDENRQQVYENENYIDMGLKGDIQKYDLTFKEMMRMSDQITVGTVERLFSGDKKKRKRKVKFENGEIEMSEAREVTLYLISKGERGYKHLTTGGIFIETDELKKNPFIFTDKDIIGLEKRLNSRQKKLVKVIISHFNRQSEVGNKISMSDIGEKIFTEPNYFPFLVDTDYIDQNKTLAQTPDDIRKKFFKGLPSITKERQNSDAPIILEDPFAAVARTTQLFNKYMDMVLVTNKTWSIINDATFRKNMIGNGFEAEYHAIRDDLMGIMTIKPFDSSEDLLKVISSIFTVSVLGYKSTVSLSQPIATVLYFPEMDMSFQEFVVASLNFKNWVEKASIKEIWDFKDHMEKLSPYLKKRFNSSMEIIKRGKQTRATAADMFFGGKQLFRGSNFGEKLGSLAKFVLSSKGAMSWIQNMDMVGVMGIWKLLEIEAIAKGYKRGTPEFNEYVARRAEHVTLMTQQTFDSLDSPPLARSGLGRLTTRFLSQTLKNTMMLRKQFFLMKKHGVASKEGFKAGCNSLGIILSQSLAVELLKVGIKAVGGGFDDDEWMTWQYWAKSLSVNVLTLFGMPGIVLSGIAGGYGNVGGGNFGALTERIGDRIKKLKSAISNQDGVAATIAIYELGKTFMPIGGPEQIYKFAKGLVEIWGL